MPNCDPARFQAYYTLTLTHMPPKKTMCQAVIGCGKGGRGMDKRCEKVQQVLTAGQGMGNKQTVSPN